MASPLYILGAGGFGRELFHWLRQHPDCGKAWEIAGFIDDKAEALRGFDYSPGVVSSVMAHQPRPGELIACAITQPRVRKPVVDGLLARGADFLTFVHPRATVGGNVRLGRGTILCPGAVVTCDVALGDFVMVNVNATVGHDARVGHNTTLSAHVDITGFCTVGDNVFLGSHAHLIPHSKVGDDAVIGAGACVVTEVAPGATVVGNPAARLR